MFWEIVGTIIFGAVIGVLARLVIPGKQSMGMIITVIIGIVGASSVTGSGARSRRKGTRTPAASTGSGGSSVSRPQSS